MKDKLYTAFVASVLVAGGLGGGWLVLKGLDVLMHLWGMH